MTIYVDEDGYVCFRDGDVFWTLHSNGWEAFLGEDDELCTPIYETGVVIFPTEDDMTAARKACLLGRRHL